MILEMSPSEIDEFVLSQKVGRVGCHVADETYVVPVIYGWDADCIYVYTTEGKKVDMMRENPHVCFEIDEYQSSGGWRSVIAQGVFEELKHDDAVRALQIISERVTSNRGAGALAKEAFEEKVARRSLFGFERTTVTGRKVDFAP